MTTSSWSAATRSHGRQHVRACSRATAPRIGRDPLLSARRRVLGSGPSPDGVGSVVPVDGEVVGQVRVLSGAGCVVAFACASALLWSLRSPSPPLLGRMSALLAPFTGPQVVRFVRFLVPGALLTMWTGALGMVVTWVESPDFRVLMCGILGIAALAVLHGASVVPRPSRPPWDGRARAEAVAGAC